MELDVAKIFAPNRRRALQKNAYLLSDVEIDKLLERLRTCPKTLQDAEEWFCLFNETSMLIADWHTYLEVSFLSHINDESFKEKLRHFEEKILVRFLSLRGDLIQTYLDLEHKNQICESNNAMMVNVFTQKKNFLSKDLAALQIREQEIIRAYQGLIYEGKSPWKNSTVTVSYLLGQMNSEHDATRKDAFFSYWKWVQKQENELQEIYSDLLKIRNEQAKSVGARSYIEYAFSDLGRTEFGINECAEFRSHVLRTVVSEIPKILHDFKPWNYTHHNRLRVSSLWSSPELTFENVEKLLKSIHPLFKFLIELMKTHGTLDIFSRKDKTSGSFCTTFQEAGLPLIFFNLGSSFKDLSLIVHEMGHALHGYLSSSIENSFLRTPGYEVCEFAAMALEALALEHYDMIVSDYAIQKKAVANAELQFLNLWPFMAMVDEFQHRVYENLEYNPKKRNAVWKSVNRLYRPYLDWSDCPDVEELGWFSRPHLFTSPFYYIDYGYAQLFACQLRQKYSQNKAATLSAFFEALKTGGQKPTSTILEIAGIQADFSGKALELVVPQLVNNIQRVISGIATNPR